MLLRELFEADSNEVAIIFGRFNPPHFGHKAAWETAAQFGNWYVGTNRSTEGPKDPLPFEVKLEAMKTIMPEIEGHIVPEQTWFTLAAWVYKEHGDNTILHIVTDSEDAQVFYPAIKKQNGQQGPHGYYNFKDIVWTEAKRLSKATNLRQAIVDNDPEAFSRAAGVPADTKVAGAPFFELVKKYMLPYMEAAAAKEREKAEKERLKAEKERAKAEKAKAKQPKGMEEGTMRNAKKLKSELYGIFSKIYAGASTGKEMIDYVADELGDYFRAVELSNDPVLQTAYKLMREKGGDAEGDPKEMSRIARKAMFILQSGETWVAEGE